MATDTVPIGELTEVTLKQKCISHYKAEMWSCFFYLCLVLMGNGTRHAKVTLTLFHSLSTAEQLLFYVYAQKSLFIAENCNAFFWTSASREFRSHRAGSQLKIFSNL